MKRLLCITAASALLTFITGCGGSRSNEANSTSTPMAAAEDVAGAETRTPTEEPPANALANNGVQAQSDNTTPPPSPASSAAPSSPVGIPSPQAGNAYFSVTLPLTNFSGDVQKVSFVGGDALSFYLDANKQVLTALAPPGVKTGPITVYSGQTAYVSTAPFQVVAGADPSADFADRDLLAQTTAPQNTWCSTSFNSNWGPSRAIYPAAPKPPFGVDPGDWKRARLIAAALKYVGLPYQHHHIPGFDGSACPASQNGTPPGLDCSNFTSWILDYAFGLKVNSAITTQASDGSAGPIIPSGAPLLPGDLLFVRGSPADGPITHVVVYIDPGHRIDETISTSQGTTLNGAYIRRWGNTGWWPYNSFSHARRPLDLVP